MGRGHGSDPPIVCADVQGPSCVRVDRPIPRRDRVPRADLFRGNDLAGMRFPLVTHDLGLNAMKLDGRKIEGKSAQQGPSFEPFQGLS